MLKLVIALAMGIVFFDANTAHAYIDPGTGGLLYQVGYIIIAGIVGYFAGLKHLFYKFLGKKGRTQEALPESAQQEPNIGPERQ